MPPCWISLPLSFFFSSMPCDLPFFLAPCGFLNITFTAIRYFAFFCRPASTGHLAAFVAVLPSPDSFLFGVSTYNTLFWPAFFLWPRRYFLPFPVFRPLVSFLPFASFWPLALTIYLPLGILLPFVLSTSLFLWPLALLMTFFYSRMSRIMCTVTRAFLFSSPTCSVKVVGEHIVVLKHSF